MAKKKTDKGHLGKAKGNNITLDFDAKIVSPDVFKKAIGAFVELLKAVSDEAVGTGKKIQWNMGVDKGSCRVIARPVADAQTIRASSLVIQAIPDGLRRLAKGTPTAPSYFDDRALRAAKDLADIKNHGGKGLDYIQIRSSGKPCAVGERTLNSIDRLLGGQHQALGSIEGKLETISARGQLQFVVYDSLYDRGVNCFMKDEIMSDAIKAFRKRVAVSGMVQYDKEGRAVSIRVDSIREFKDVADLPPIHELRGIFRRGE